jgi:hypothetical protein
LTLWDFLASPQGQDVTHALVLVLASIAAWFSYHSHKHLTK